MSLRSWVIRIILYSTVLHLFGLVQFWHSYPVTDVELVPYFNEFQVLTGKDLSNVQGAIRDKFAYRMPWMPKDSQFIGLCTPLVLSTMGSEIVLWKNFWALASVTERRLLVFHELAHCACHRMHDSSKFSDGCPKSIMSPILSIDLCAIVHYDDYINDLKERCK